MIRLLELILGADLVQDNGLIYPYVALPLFIFFSIVALSIAWIIVIFLKTRKPK
jgi:hypothetical protein